MRIERDHKNNQIRIRYFYRPQKSFNPIFEIRISEEDQKSAIVNCINNDSRKLRFVYKCTNGKLRRYKEGEPLKRFVITKAINRTRAIASRYCQENFKNKVPNSITFLIKEKGIIVEKIKFRNTNKERVMP